MKKDFDVAPHTRKWIIFVGVAMLLMAVLVPHSLFAQPAAGIFAHAVSVQGRIEVRRASQSVWQPVKLKDRFTVGDVVRVGPRSRADIQLMTETVIRLDQNTTLAFAEPEKETFSVVRLLKGAFYFFANRPRVLRIVTPFVNGFVEGTEFYVRVNDDETLFSLFKGRLTLANDQGSLTLGEGQSAVAGPEGPPMLKTVVRPRDAVAWTLYYPPLFICSPVDFQKDPSSPWKDAVQKAMEAYDRGDIAAGIEGLKGVPDAVDDPRLLACRASLLFSVGRSDEAGRDLDRILKRSPKYGPALAMKSVVALTVNDKKSALELARRAVEGDPQSAPAWLALSYAQQGNFDLDGALASTGKAVELAPREGLDLARLAELRLSFGRLDRALADAQRAAEASPGQGRPATVLGFAYLTQMKVKEAKETFEKAIQLDQADPLPRLGLGLAIINEGDLSEGRAQIEIAASLDPRNSLVRSYLGKAYYEEKRAEKAAEQFALARQLDPADPTPYLYDAILKQSINRPVEALRDLEKSIELNDQRAVYRSRLLLDEDIAVRSVSLARIYGDLGFEQRALVEGWKSANTDPANYSAHRFLADSYSALPRHEIARVSELLQSQLLQPLNINPVQPSLAQSGGLPWTSVGPADPTFNEYTPLFERNRVALLASGIAGTQSTWGDEAMLSGVWGRWSTSIGQLHYQTDGYRNNNDAKTDVYNLFGQVRLSYKTSVQVELRSESTNMGDIEQRFFSWDSMPNKRQKQNSDSVRLGFHHSFDPGSDLIASVVYKQGKDTFRDLVPLSPVGYSYSSNDDAFIGEMQHIFRKDRFSLIAGGGYANIDRSDTTTTGILMDPPLVFISSESSTINHTNLYAYSQINYPKNLILTLGASGDFLSGAVTNRNQFNPKFGITWNPLPSTTVRGAIFRTLKRTLITNQTIEPTQVAGFNQFYDDSEATGAWRYGIALDQKFGGSLYGGLECSGRTLDVPVEDVVISPLGIPLTVEKNLTWRERQARAYLYWAPQKWLALTAEYLFERFDRDALFGAGVELVRTNRVPLSVSLIHPLGFTFRARGTYIDQRGLFRPQYILMPTDPSIPGENDFWVIDASLSYRLPRRYGMVTVGVKNLFDRSFKYQDMDPFSPKTQPSRFVYGRLTLSF